MVTWHLSSHWLQVKGVGGAGSLGRHPPRCTQWCYLVPGSLLAPSNPCFPGAGYLCLPGTRQVPCLWPSYGTWETDSHILPTCPRAGLQMAAGRKEGCVCKNLNERTLAFSLSHALKFLLTQRACDCSEGAILAERMCVGRCPACFTEKLTCGMFCSWSGLCLCPGLWTPPTGSARSRGHPPGYAGGRSRPAVAVYGDGGSGCWRWWCGCQPVGLGLE